MKYLNRQKRDKLKSYYSCLSQRGRQEEISSLIFLLELDLDNLMKCIREGDFHGIKLYGNLLRGRVEHVETMLTAFSLKLKSGEEE